MWSREEEGRGRREWEYITSTFSLLDVLGDERGGAMYKMTREIQCKLYKTQIHMHACTHAHTHHSSPLLLLLFYLIHGEVIL